MIHLAPIVESSEEVDAKGETIAFQVNEMTHNRERKVAQARTLARTKWTMDRQQESPQAASITTTVHANTWFGRAESEPTSTHSYATILAMK